MYDKFVGFDYNYLYNYNNDYLWYEEWCKIIYFFLLKFDPLLYINFGGWN